MTSRPTMLLIGPVDGGGLLALSDSFGATFDAIAVANCRIAESLLSEGELAPDWIVVVQQRPGQYNPNELERLLRAAPLSPLIMLLGSWCEGEPRSGNPWPSAIRVYWYDFPTRIDQALAARIRGQCSHWSLPTTTTEEERLLYSARRTPNRSGGNIVVAARRRDIADAIVDACQARGFHAEWFRLVAANEPSSPFAFSHSSNRLPSPTPLAAIWEGRRADAEEIAEIGRLRQAVGDAPIIALVDFPRPEDHAALLAAGAAAVIAKPMLLDDIFRQIDRLTGKSPKSATSESSAA